MARLTICLLGPFQVAVDGQPVVGFESDKVRALLSYLAAEPDRAYRRETLAGLLWPDRPDQAARTNLRRALANMRQALNDRSATPPYLCVSHQTIQFNPEADIWIDTAVFSQYVETSTSNQSANEQLKKALALYRGEFLEGVSIGDSAGFEEWLLLKREYLRRLAIQALQQLADWYEQSGDYAAALAYGWRLVDLEPWREKTHRQLMRLLALTGQRSAALTQYETCRRLLSEELDVDPSAETTRLYQQIRNEEFAPPAPPVVQIQSVSTPIEPAEALSVMVEKSASHPDAEPKRPGRSGKRRLFLMLGSLLLLLVIAGAGILLTVEDDTGVVVFQDNFEDGQAANWDLESGWTVEQQDSSYVLRGADHAWARPRLDEYWTDYSLIVRLKLINDDALHLNYRISEEHGRYYFGFRGSESYLAKQVSWGKPPNVEILARVTTSYPLNTWHTVEIEGAGDNIKVYINDELQLDYTDPEPLTFGRFALETIENSYVYVDEVQVTLKP